MPACAFAKNLYSLALYAKVWFPWKCFPWIPDGTRLYYWYNSPGSLWIPEYILLSSLSSSLALSLCWPPFHSPSYSLCTSVKCTCTVFFFFLFLQSVEGFPDGMTQGDGQYSVFLTPFLRLLFLIPLTSILPFHHRYRSHFSNPQPLQSLQECVTVLLEAMYQSQLNSFIILSFISIIHKKADRDSHVHFCL